MYHVMVNGECCTVKDTLIFESLAELESYAADQWDWHKGIDGEDVSEAHGDYSHRQYESINEIIKLFIEWKLGRTDYERRQIRNQLGGFFDEEASWWVMHSSLPEKYSIHKTEEEAKKAAMGFLKEFDDCVSVSVYDIRQPYYRSDQYYRHDLLMNEFFNVVQTWGKEEGRDYDFEYCFDASGFDFRTELIEPMKEGDLEKALSTCAAFKDGGELFDDFFEPEEDDDAYLLSEKLEAWVTEKIKGNTSEV
jgi:hypothetical protein